MGVCSYKTPACDSFKHCELPDYTSVSAVTADICSMVNIVCLFMKTHLLALL